MYTDVSFTILILFPGANHFLLKVYPNWLYESSNLRWTDLRKGQGLHPETLNHDINCKSPAPWKPQVPSVHHVQILRSIISFTRCNKVVIDYVLYAIRRRSANRSQRIVDADVQNEGHNLTSFLFLEMFCNHCRGCFYRTFNYG